MKRLIFIGFLFLSIFSFGQGQDIIINTARLDGIMYGNKSGGVDSLISPHPDSLGQFQIKNVADPEELLDAVNLRTLLNNGGYDSLVYDDGYLRGYSGGSVMDSTLIDATTLTVEKESGLVHLGTLSEHHAHVSTAFLSVGGAITDNLDSTITIDSSEVSLKITNDIDAPFKAVMVSDTTFTLAVDVNYILYVDYNSGNPIYAFRVSTPGYFYNNWDVLPFATAINIGSRIIINDFRLATTNGVAKNILSQLNYEAVRYLGGLLTSETGTRQLEVSAGAVLVGNDYSAIASVNTSTGDTFTRMYYTTGSGWTRTTGQTTVSNSEYNDIATGLATLTATPERWANKWLFHIEDSPDFNILIEGQTAYTSLSDAQEGQLPSVLPPEVNQLYAGAILVAKIIVSGNETNIVEIENPFTTTFTTTAASSHNNLSDLQIAGSGITYGHINDQDADIYGGKTFTDSIYARTMIVTDSSKNVATTEFVKFQNVDLLDDVNAAIASKQDTITAVYRDTIFIVDNGVVVVDSATGGVTETGVIIHDNDSLVASNIYGKNYGDQQLTTTGAAGQIAINGVNGNSIVINVDDADASNTNEFQNLGYTASPTDGTVGISNGTNATVPLATTVNAGLMSPAQYDAVEAITGWNNSVQTLVSTIDTLVVDSGLNATLTISGNTDIRIEGLEEGMTGNITVTCSAANDSLSFSGYTFKIAPVLESVSGKIPVTVGSGEIDVYSYWYDGTRVIINGTKYYQ